MLYFTVEIFPYLLFLDILDECLPLSVPYVMFCNLPFVYITHVLFDVTGLGRKECISSLLH
jgi:hypothetical protein